MEGRSATWLLLAIDIRVLPPTPPPHPPPRFQFLARVWENVSYIPSSVTAAGSDVYGEG